MAEKGFIVLTQQESSSSPSEQLILTEEKEEQQQFLIELLPDELTEEIFARFSLESLCKSRSVCRQWNNLFLSTKFITNQWAKEPPNVRPRLIICHASSPLCCFTFCFFTGTWKACISLSFLTEKVDGKFYEANCNGSAAGLLLVDIYHSPDARRSRSVCNPLTRRSLILPALSSIIRTKAEGIVGGDEAHGRISETYKVVVVGDRGRHTRNTQLVEIYDSREESWRIAGQLPENVKVRASKIVFCGGFFYSRAVLNHTTPGIVGFSLQDGTSFFVPLPDVADRGQVIRPHQLFVCGSRVLMAGWIVEVGLAKYEVAIWELIEKVGVVGWSSSTAWKEITRIPPYLWEDVKTLLRFRGSSEFEGVGNYVCVRGTDADMDVLAYNLCDNSWNWLPACPMMRYFREHKSKSKRYCDPGTQMYSFEPRVDMKVGFA